MERPVEYIDRVLGYYNNLKGAKILEVTLEKDPHNPGVLYPTLKVEYSNGSVGVVYVDCDEEGNGPGFLAGIESPAMLSMQEELENGLDKMLGSE